MRTPRFITSGKELKEENSGVYLWTPEEDQRHHLLKVLRKKISAQISLFDKDSSLELLCSILEIGQKSLRLKLIEQIKKEPRSEVVALIGLSKASTMDFICEKLSELGAAEICFYKGEHSSYSLKKDEIEKRLERLRRISLAAIKQSFSGTNSQIRIEESLESALIKIKCAEQACLKLCFSTSDAQGFKDFEKEFSAKEKPTQKNILLIGCEGGLSENELALAKTNGFKMLSLGSSILRVETAAIIAVSLANLFLEKD